MAGSNFANAFYQALQTRLASHPTYSQDYRMGKNSYDCSSLMNRGLQDLKIPGVNPAATTANMNPSNNYMRNLGFQWVPKSQGLLPGDILWKNGHTEFYVGGRRTLGAHGTKNGVSEYDLQGPEKFQGGWRYVGDRFLGGTGNLGNGQVHQGQAQVANVPVQGMANPAVQQAVPEVRPTVVVQMPQEQPRGFSGWTPQPRPMVNSQASAQLLDRFLSQIQSYGGGLA